MSKRGTEFDIFKVPSPAAFTGATNLPLRLERRRQKYSDSNTKLNLTDAKNFGAFANVLAKEFLAYTSGVSPATQDAYLFPVQQLCKFAGNFDLSRTAESWGAIEWKTLVDSYADNIKKATGLRPTTKNDYIDGVNRFMRHMQVKNIIPEFRLPKGIKNAHLTAGRKKSVGELLPTNWSLFETPPAIAAADEEIREVWRQLTLLWNTGDSKVVLARINLIFKAIREAAQREIREAWSEFKKVNSQIAATDVQAVFDFLEKNNGRYTRSLGSGRGCKSIFEIRENLLAYIAARYDGIVPSKEIDPQLLRFVWNNGGLKAFRDMFHTTADNIIPFLSIMLIDAPMNVSDSLEVTTDCLEQTEHPSKFWFHWIKDRADEDNLSVSVRIGHRSALELDSERDITIPQCIECLLKMRSRLTNVAIGGDEKYLFLVLSANPDVVKSTAQNRGVPASVRLNDSRAAKAWRRFCKRHPVLSEFRLTLDQFRTTCLLKEKIETGNIFRVQRKGAHKNLSHSL